MPNRTLAKPTQQPFDPDEVAKSKPVNPNGMPKVANRGRIVEPARLVYARPTGNCATYLHQDIDSISEHR